MADIAQKRFGFNPFREGIPAESHEFDLFVDENQFPFFERVSQTTLSVDMNGMLACPQRGDVVVLGKRDDPAAEKTIIPFVILNALYGVINKLDPNTVVLNLVRLTTPPTEMPLTDEELKQVETALEKEGKKVDPKILQSLENLRAAPVPTDESRARPRKSMPPVQDEGVEDLGDGAVTG